MRDLRERRVIDTVHPGLYPVGSTATDDRGRTFRVTRHAWAPPYLQIGGNVTPQTRIVGVRVRGKSGAR